MCERECACVYFVLSCSGLFGLKKLLHFLHFILIRIPKIKQLSTFSGTCDAYSVALNIAPIWSLFVAPQLVSLQEAKLLLKEDDELIKEVFDYWSRKRKTSKCGSLIPNVKQEKRDGSSTSDPYVAFRRRTEKMQTRKVVV